MHYIRTIVLHCALVVLLIGASFTQSFVLCIEANGDISMDRVLACECSKESPKSDGGRVGPEIHLSEMPLPDDGCDPCVDISLKIDAAHVVRAAFELPGDRSNSVTDVAALWATTRALVASSAGKFRRVVPLYHRPPIYEQTTSYLI